MGVPWLSYLLVGLLFSLLIMALLPPANPPSHTVSVRRDQLEAETDAFVALNLFFWVVMIGFVAVIIIGYFI